MSQDPKYTQVKELLKRQIGVKYPVGSKLPSTLDLHRALGVSPGTVNRAVQELADEGLVSRQGGRGTFVLQTDKDIGLVWPEAGADWTRAQYSSATVRAVEAEAERQGRHLLVRGLRDAGHPPFLSPGRSKVAGVLVLFNWRSKIVEAYHARGIPVVLVDPMDRTPGVPFVTSDHYSASREAVRHLAIRGHRRILHVNVEPLAESIPSLERVAGYRRAMAEAGLEDWTRVYYTAAVESTLLPPEEVKTSLDRAARRLLELFDEFQPTACCCYDDVVAAWIIRTCLDRGIRVPQDLSVVGINDMPAAELIWPRLTTVHLPVAEISRAAMGMIDALIRENRLTGEGLIFPGRLVERDSTQALSIEGAAAATESEPERA